MATAETGGGEERSGSLLRLSRVWGARDDVEGRSLESAALATQVERERIARHAAESASRAKSELVASASHELRTPVGCIIGLVDLVLATELTSEQREHLTLLRGSAASLLGVLNGLLDLAKVEAGRIDLDVTSFSLRELLREAVQPLVVGARAQGVVVETRVAEHVPDALRGAAGGLRQIVVNLVANALRFTTRGTVAIAVDGERYGAGSLLLRTAVRDTGVGIEPEQQEAVFDAFAQGSAPDGGTGLGLTVCRQLAGLMGGRIEVESVVGVGTTFLVVVPFGVELGEASVHFPLLEPAISGPPRPLSVLVADDHPVSRCFVEALLRRAGHRVALAANGPAALGLFDRERFDVVLMDGHMPEMDGFETTRAIRQREKSAQRSPIPIVALTARAMSDDRQRFLGAGFDAYLSKPVEGPTLLRLLQAIVRPAVRGEDAGDRPSPPVDAGRLLTLVRGDGALARSLVAHVVAETPADLAELRTALACDDTSNVLGIVHRLWGALIQIAATPAVETLARVPCLYGAGAKRMVEALVAEIETEMTELPRVVDDLLAPPGAPAV